MNDILYVWIYPEGAQQPALCGKLELLRGRRCLFSYEEAWLQHPQSFALSPDMALRSGVMEPPAGQEIHPIFEDAGPDRWGQAVINKIFNPRRRSHLEYLELAGEDRIGALGFSRSRDAYLVAEEQAFHTADLPGLIRAAQALENQMPIDDAMRRLLRPGASAGGARPKAIITHNNEDWLAKFPADGDQADVCALEHASLRLAARCGIRVPESSLQQISGRNVLLVKRFDREGASRLHFASARTMLIAEGVDLSDMGYADIADLARRLSKSPQEDCLELFRRMALNVCLENTDDHEKNHAFLFKGSQWQLAPAYDIQPQLQGLGYQQLRIGDAGHEPTLSNVLSSSSRFLLKKDAARDQIAEILAQLRDWREHFAQDGVSDQDIQMCSQYVMTPSILAGV